MARQDDLDRFYRLIDDLEQRACGTRKLKNCTGYMDWPDRGVYFFLEPGETRDSADQLRVTRVGTHAVSEGSSMSLWDRAGYSESIVEPFNPDVKDVFLSTLPVCGYANSSASSTDR